MLAGQLSFQARKSKRDDQDGDKGSAARSHGVAAWHAPAAAGIPFTSDRPRHCQRSSFSFDVRQGVVTQAANLPTFLPRVQESSGT
ncbi:hypothetical protein [Paraburkholderia youngii]|uniref:hypothetical protein n=1 Tax=Paraburkholderia youngii TaxID=2782701 RepID=UPI003D1927D5